MTALMIAARPRADSPGNTAGVETLIGIRFEPDGLGLKDFGSLLELFERLVAARCLSILLPIARRGLVRDAVMLERLEVIEAFLKGRARDGTLSSAALGELLFRIAYIPAPLPPMTEDRDSRPLGVSHLRTWNRHTIVPLLPIVEVRLGSIEFWCNVINLVTIFGLQDQAILKDVIQWTTGALSKMLGQSTYEPGVVYTAGVGKLYFDPEVLGPLTRDFDEVIMEEERTDTTVRLKVVLRRSTGPSYPVIADAIE